MTSRPSQPRFFFGWKVAIVAAMATFTEVTFFNPVLGVLLPQFEHDFGWSRTEISLAVTLGTLFAAVIAPLFGPLIDRYGGRPFVVGGGITMAAGMVAMANMQTEWQFFIVYGLGRATATGLISVAATVTVSKWFIRRRSLAVGFTTFGTRLAYAVMPVGIQLIINISDWRTACYVLGGMVALIGIVPAALWLHRQPEDIGLLPDGDSRSISHGGSKPSLAHEENWSRDDAVRTLAFWMLTLAVSLQTFSSSAINLHQVPYMVDQGIGEGRAALVLSLYAVFACVGGLLQGLVEQRFKLTSRVIFALGMLGSAAGVVILAFTHTFALAIAFAAVFGTAYGLLGTSQHLVFAEYFGRGSLGSIRGASLPLFMVLQAFGPLTAGAFYDVTGSYVGAFLVFALGFLIGAAALVVANKPNRPVPAAPSLVGIG